jgi:tryptophan synthase alpha chain
MSRITNIFAAHRANGCSALMPFITAGYPTLEDTTAAIPVIESAGASIVELGVPFSDPIADGPVIAASMHEALQRGATPTKIFDLVRQIRSQTALGLVAMVSDSIVARMQPETFVRTAAAAGIDGLIVPDIDLDAARELRLMADDHNLTLTLLIAPTTTTQRRDQLASICSGFVYLLARLGITGERDTAPDVAAQVEAMRHCCDLPVAVGFGISSPDHVRAVTEHADAAIVGSALVRRMGEASNPVQAAGDFVRHLASGLVRRASE